ncbi:AAA family ATPase [Janibacter terrae]|uniref:AAA family ATPase n=1 Tax=Janibacter terrae TaxID=103817 RepID=UPI00380FD7F9
MSDLIDSLARAVGASPQDLPLRLHLAQLLVDAGRGDEAVTHCATVLQQDPGNAAARDLMTAALTPGPTSPGPTTPAPARSHDGFDWSAAEGEMGDISPQPMFVDGDPGASEVAAHDLERPAITLEDVGGMQQVKARLDAAFLAPLRHPELRKAYGKSLKGGILLYGPPGCGKTFVGRALAGELGAGFVNVGISDVLDMYTGRSERNVSEIFEFARSHAPTVVFLDELDAIGAKRATTHNSGLRTVVNQLLMEMDGVEADNEGVFVVGATNQPWDVDAALRRPGRLDRTLFVAPPDEEARAAIFRHHLADRPVEGVDVAWLARRSQGLSGADIAHVCETATEFALMEGARTGTMRWIGMADLKRSLGEVRPSTGPWFTSARNVVEFANVDGAYDELRDWMRKNKVR